MTRIYLPAACCLVADTCSTAEIAVLPLLREQEGARVVCAGHQVDRHSRRHGGDEGVTGAAAAGQAARCAGDGADLTCQAVC